jgi:hypothetical protein
MVASIKKKKYIIGCDTASSGATDSTVISWIHDDGCIEMLVKPPDMEEIQKVILAVFGMPKQYFGQDNGKGIC